MIFLVASPAIYLIQSAQEGQLLGEEKFLLKALSDNIFLFSYLFHGKFGNADADVYDVLLVFSYSLAALFISWTSRDLRCSDYISSNSKFLCLGLGME